MTAGDVIGTGICSLEARQGASFDGTDDYILADAHAVARVAANDTTGTYSAWIFVDNNTISQTILSSGDFNVDEYLQFHLSSDLLSIKVTVAGVTKFETRQVTANIPSNKWTHVAIVQDGIQPALYVNGLKVTTSNITATNLTDWYDELTGCDKFAIGILERNGTHVSDFAGMISDVKYWNKPLTAAEILADYKGEALSDDGTYLQLHLLKYGSLTDVGLGANDGTLTGNAYLNGYGSEWSRKIDLSGAVVADNITSVAVSDGYKRGAISAIVKAA